MTPPVITPGTPPVTMTPEEACRFAQWVASGPRGPHCYHMGYGVGAYVVVFVLLAALLVLLVHRRGES